MDNKPTSSDATAENSFDKPGPSGVGLTKKLTRRSHSQLSCSTCCPVCGVTIKTSNAAAHFAVELSRLKDVGHHRNGKRARTEVDRSTGTLHEERRQVMKSVRLNRSKRLTLKTAPAHRRTRIPGQVDCPVCNQVINHLSETERISHVEDCLNSHNNTTSEIDIVGGSSESELEEYEWAGQTRIRSVARSDIVPRSNRNGEEEDSGDLDVDGNDDAVYGDSQFSEADLISTSQDNSSLRIREAMLRTAGANSGAPSEVPSKWDTLEDLSWTQRLEDEEKSPPEPKRAESPTPVLVEALKSRIRELESAKSCAGGLSPRCLVCMEAYLNPVVSICCWHVYCQDCWLKTLSCKKLCPQCSMITSPGNLRRIFL